MSRALNLGPQSNLEKSHDEAWASLLVGFNSWLSKAMKDKEIRLGKAFYCGRLRAFVAALKVNDHPRMYIMET